MPRLSLAILALLLAASNVDAAAYTLTDYGVVNLDSGSYPIYLNSSGQVAFGHPPYVRDSSGYSFTSKTGGPDRDKDQVLYAYGPGLSQALVPAIPSDGLPNWGRLSGDQAGVAINRNGELIGYTLTIANHPEAFLWNATTPKLAPQYIALGTGASSSQPYSINDSGLIVGTMVNSNYETRAFLSNGTTTTDLNDLIGPGSGLVLNSAVQIGDLGQIVGYATDSSGQTHEVLLTPQITPEPSVLLGLFVFGSILCTYRLKGRSIAMLDLNAKTGTE